MASKKKKTKPAVAASDGQVIAVDANTIASKFNSLEVQDGGVFVKPLLEVGKTYTGTDGNTYEVLAVNATSIVARRDKSKNKIPFGRDQFEVLVGLMSEDDYKAGLEEKRLERKRAAEAREPREGRVSTMSVIRACLANNLEATVEEIAAACKAAGVPAKSEGTIKTIMSDFKQVYKALFDADRIVID